MYSIGLHMGRRQPGLTDWPLTEPGIRLSARTTAYLNLNHIYDLRTYTG